MANQRRGRYHEKQLGTKRKDLENAYLFDPWEWQASNFFLQYHWITHLGHKRYGNDPRLQQKTILIVKKFSLSVPEEM